MITISITTLILIISLILIIGGFIYAMSNIQGQYFPMPNEAGCLAIAIGVVLFILWCGIMLGRGFF